MTYKEMEESKDELKNITACISILGMLAALVFAVGTAGAVDTDDLDLKTGAVRIVIAIVIMVLCVVGIRYSES